MKLKDMLAALRERGREEEAMLYGTLIPAQLYLRQRISEKRVLNMELEEIETYMRLPEKPLKYDGWQHYWGKAAFR